MNEKQKNNFNYPTFILVTRFYCSSGYYLRIGRGICYNIDSKIDERIYIWKGFSNKDAMGTFLHKPVCILI